MENNRFSSFFGGNGEKWLGGLIGLEFGILRTLFIAACVGVGVYFGSKKRTESGFPSWCKSCSLMTDKEKAGG